MKWDNDWRNEMTKGCDNRLANCRNTKTDIKRIAKLIYKYNSENGKQACLDMAITWICDWNGQLEIAPNKNEYISILNNM